ncbi:hypothetical protein [Lysinibacillus xylanilyticus]|uniref:hypothetical protein n=1 Tax=Lysinibacillus xylanilyticus TaxID=582475 RepID=UPI00158637E4|nr:hypothetical protein [Lysinibacillus xylanilyticus]
MTFSDKCFICAKAKRQQQCFICAKERPASTPINSYTYSCHQLEAGELKRMPLV